MLGRLLKIFGNSQVTKIEPNITKPSLVPAPKSEANERTVNVASVVISPKASQASIPVQPKKDSKNVPKIRELKEEEKGSGVIFSIAKYFRTSFFNFCKGEDPREKHFSTSKDPLTQVATAMDYLAASTIKLNSVDDVKLEGKHFTLACLMSKMKEAGGKKVNIEYLQNKNDKAIIFEFSGYVLEKCEKTEKLISAYTTMGFFTQNYKNDKDEIISIPGPWEHKEIDGKIYIWKKDTHQKIKDGISYVANKQVLDSSKVKVTSLEEIKIEPSRSTIILNGGIHSYYESHRVASEIARLMALGIDVVVSQDKHSELLGSEAHEHVSASRAAIYEYLSSKGMANQQIIWKGTCFSAIPAVEAAAKYKGSHVVIDQGYVDTVDQASDHILPNFVKPLLKPVIQGCVESALDAFHFTYNMTSHLPNVEGKVCIIENQNDLLISATNVHRMKKLLGDKKPEVLTITNEKVKHADGWFYDERCATGFSQFLIKNKFSTGSII